MEKKQSRAQLKYGLDPGSLVYVGDERTREATVKLVIFSKDDYSEADSFTEDVVKNAVNEGKTIWLNVNGIHNTGLISETGRIFNIHPLTLEDILNTHHRPKTEDVNDYLFVVLKHLAQKENTGAISTEQISLIIHKNFVITFQEDDNDDLEIIRESLRQNKGKVRELSPDYLAYRIIDIIIDSYFDIVEKTGERIELLGDELVQNPGKQTLRKIYRLKNEMLVLRRVIWPLREAVSSLEKSETEVIKNTTRPFLRDLYDHVIQLIDSIENNRDIVAGMMDIYLSSISNKLNEIMKVLTIISTFFIPLNFIAGVYGMNFNTSKSPFNMPELNFYFGYPAALLLMAAVASVLFVYFKKRKWF